jgi:hypothetical protein
MSVSLPAACARAPRWWTRCGTTAVPIVLPSSCAGNVAVGIRVPGTLSFDSAHSLAENRFNDPAAEEICRIVATCVYRILREG